MKKYFVIFLMYFSCSRESDQFAEINVDREVVNLGSHARSEVKVATFTISNVGQIPLVIEDVTMDCQCTLVDWSDKRVLSSGKTVIKVRYDNSNSGPYQQLVYVKANTNKPVTLIIRGKIV